MPAPFQGLHPPSFADKGDTGSGAQHLSNVSHAVHVPPSVGPKVLAQVQMPTIPSSAWHVAQHAHRDSPALAAGTEYGSDNISWPQKVQGMSKELL